MSEREIVRTDAAPAPIGPYNQAIAAGPYVFLSGQVGMGPDGNLAEGGVEPQARQLMQNIAAVLSAAGLGFRDVVKTNIYLIDMNDFAAVNTVYGAAFEGAEPPARTTIAVAALPRGARVEIELIALRR